MYNHFMLHQFMEYRITTLLFLSLQCDPAIEFTFKLVLLYGNLKNAKKEFEIIYVGFDEDEREWQEYSNSMPWVSFPYEDERAVELRKLFDVEGKMLNVITIIASAFFCPLCRNFWCLHRYSHTDSDRW